MKIHKLLCLLPLMFMFVACYDDSELMKRIETLEATTAATLKSSIETLEGKQMVIRERIAELESSGSAVESELEDLKKKDKEISESIAELKEWVEGLFKGYYSAQEIDSQVAEINKLIEELSKRVSDLEAIVANLTREFSISFSYAELGVLAGSTNTIDYTITGATANTVVKAICNNGGWKATVNQRSKDKGTIKITAPDPLVEDEILIFVYDGANRTIMSSINLVTGVATPSITSKELPIEGGTFTWNLTTNMDYQVEIPEKDRSWISVSGGNTKATRVDNFSVHIQANTGTTRHSILSIKSGSETVSSLSIVQKGNEPYLTVSTASVECSYPAYTTTFQITSNVDWTITSSEPWCSVSSKRGSGSQIITLSVDENKTNGKRSAKIVIKTVTGNLSETMTVSQAKPPYYYLISTQSDLEDFRAKVNGGERGLNGRLTADIALTGNWTPIGTKDNPYGGVFDGNGYSVSGIQISGGSVVGFFSYTNGAKIHDLTVMGSIRGSTIGGLIAKADATRIDRCKSDMTLIGSNVGGLVSELRNSHVTNCACHGKIGNSNCWEIGGIAYLNGTGSTIKNSYSSCQINCMADVGGVVYYNAGTIENCLCNNAITVWNAGAGLGLEGGVVGYNDRNAKIRYSYFLKQAPINTNLNAVGDLNWGENTYVRSFNGSANFSSSVVIGSKSYSKVGDALNAWVNTNQTTGGTYLSWDGRYFKK